MRHLFFMAFIAISSHSFAETSIVYGTDNRVEVKDVKNISKLTAAIAGRVKNSKFLKYDYNGVENSMALFTHSVRLSDAFGANVCSDEKFSNQLMLSDCTGFLVGDDLLATAGHCITMPGIQVENSVNLNCARFSWLFDFKVNSSGVFDNKKVPAKNLFGCKKIVFATVDLNLDFALIQLDRKVKGRTPLKIRKHGSISRNDKLFVIGHPTGLPMKYADGAKVLDNSPVNYFATNLDTFGGNSGSPVFNAKTKKVEGILVRGRTDYVPSPDPKEHCMRVNRCTDDGRLCYSNGGPNNGEHVTRISEILDYL